MKKLLLLLSISFAGFSCLRDETPSTVTVKSDEIVRVGNDNVLSFTIETEANWEILAIGGDDEGSWMNLSATSGSGSFEVVSNVEPNINNDPRVGFITIRTTAPCGSRYKITVIQSGRVEAPYMPEHKYIHADSTDFLFDANPVDLTRKFKVSSNDSWKIVMDDIAPQDQWFAVDATSGSGDCEITLTLTNPASETIRRSYFYLIQDSAPNDTIQLNVTTIPEEDYEFYFNIEIIEGPHVLKPDVRTGGEFQFPVSTGGVGKVKINTNGPWFVPYHFISSVPMTVSHNNSYGWGDAVITITTRPWNGSGGGWGTSYSVSGMTGSMKNPIQKSMYVGIYQQRSFN